MKTFIRNICILLAAVASSAVSAKGETFSIDYSQVRLTYEITSDSSVSVVWIDVLDFENEIDLRIPESAEIDGKTYAVTGFWYDNEEEGDAYYKNEQYYISKYGNIRSITFPHTLISMQSGSDSYSIRMRGYAGLKKITIDNAAVVFIGISDIEDYIEEIDFGNSLIRVDSWACYWLKALKKIRLPEYCQIGSMAFCWCSSLQEIEWVPNGDNSYKGRGDDIGQEAFRDCTSLKDFSTYMNIGNYAFIGCTALEKVDIKNDGINIGEYAFEGCSALKEIDLSRCREINDRAFLNCTELRKVCFPDQLWKLGNNVFQGCPNIDNITVVHVKYIEVNSGDKKYSTLLTAQDDVLYSRRLEGHRVYDEKGYSSDDGFSMYWIDYYHYPSKLCFYPAGKKDTSFTVPDVAFGDLKTKVTEISGGAFANNSYLEKVTVVSGQLKNQSTFEGCQKLKEVEILPGGTVYKCLEDSQDEYEELPDSMVNIPYCTFKDCTALEKVTIPDSYLMVGHNSFEGCNGIKEINLPSELMCISDGAFNECTALKEVKLPEKVIEIGTNSFRGCDALEKVEFAVAPRVKSVGAGAFWNCKALNTIELPETLDSIGPNAFKECHSLPEIRIPDSVTKLGRWAFENCKSAKTVSIGKGIQELEVYSFWGCSNAERLEIGENVEKIGQDAFTGMDRLKVIVCNPLTPPDYPTGFSEEVKKNATLYVPEGASGDYNADSTWQPFTQVEAVEEVSKDEIKFTSHGVVAPDGVRVEVYTMAGHLVACGTGSLAFDIAPGIYLVRTAGNVRKISIR